MPKSIQVDPFTVYSGKIAVYDADNVDTDRIIPARFLSLVTKSGYGSLLFSDVRGQGFPLDEPAAADCSILVVGTNFGCGSSREHAVWALQQAGFRAIIARQTQDSPGYSDIFRQNSANCGLLLIELNDKPHQELVASGTGSPLTIDLPRQKVMSKDHEYTFEINSNVKNALIEGLDLIGTTLQFERQISEYETTSQAFVPSRA